MAIKFTNFTQKLDTLQQAGYDPNLILSIIGKQMPDLGTKLQKAQEAGLDANQIAAGLERQGASYSPSRFSSGILSTLPGLAGGIGGALGGAALGTSILPGIGTFLGGVAGAALGGGAGEFARQEISKEKLQPKRAGKEAAIFGGLEAATGGLGAFIRVGGKAAAPLVVREFLPLTAKEVAQIGKPEALDVARIFIKEGIWGTLKGQKAKIATEVTGALPKISSKLDDVLSTLAPIESNAVRNTLLDLNVQLAKLPTGNPEMTRAVFDVISNNVTKIPFKGSVDRITVNTIKKEIWEVLPPYFKSLAKEGKLIPAGQTSIYETGSILRDLVIKDSKEAARLLKTQEGLIEGRKIIDKLLTARIRKPIMRDAVFSILLGQMTSGGLGMATFLGSRALRGAYVKSGSAIVLDRAAALTEAIGESMKLTFLGKAILYGTFKEMQELARARVQSPQQPVSEQLPQ